MEIFSETFKKVWKLWEIRSLVTLSWKLWEIRSLVTLSLCLQIILIILASRRKITNPHSRIGILLNVTIWCAYIAADWVATVALGVMAGSEANDSSKASNRLHAFWAPFLLLHLGGPDNITAFSMEDNDLWLRHLLMLIVEVGVAFYVFMMFWSSSALTFLAIPVFIAGTVKYGERTWALWSSGTQFNSSEGSFPVASDVLIDSISDDINPEDHNLVQAYFLYACLRYRFMDHRFLHTHKERIRLIIREKSAEDLFKIVETELALMYDVLYTKADIVYSRFGICLRCISFICSISALVLFSIIIDVRSYRLIDIAVTYLLLVGAVILETYSLIILISSDWTKLWLISWRSNTTENQISRTVVDNFQRFTNCLHSCFTTEKRWSESIGQYNLKTSADRERQRTYQGLEKLSCTRKLLGKYQYLSWANVDISLQQTIFNYLDRIARELGSFARYQTYFRQLHDEYLSKKGEHALREYEYKFREFLDNKDFDARVIMWHLVTNNELECLDGHANQLNQDCKIGKWLSEYMIYLLLFRPFIFPKGIGQLRYDHTYKHIIQLLPVSNSALTAQTYKDIIHLLPVSNSALTAQPRNPSTPPTYSLLKSANRLASRWKDDEIDRNIRWKVIIEVWLELLTHAASHFEWKEHTQYLRRGGELITLVSVLMIHFRLSKQIT